ncbi:hypothetical protein Tsubulata_029202 [Turnera subulata]|uniref:Reverse transcriptase zinc-binding domain-containing protein n=1 Tax=Turnera subulata TaxID=218843 RepID=A0A9Q0JKH2_9ROSI|nr:hypothetical protein Tsubulata_029202 [Turnera subulata]
METVDHMLLHCSVVYSLWQRLARWWGTTWVMPGSLEAWLPQWLSPAGALRCQEVWMTLGYSMLWSLWLAKNSLVFESKTLYGDALFDLVLTRAFWWIKVSHPLFPYPMGCILATREAFKGWSGKTIHLQYG